jgi:hypothetical protein
MTSNASNTVCHLGSETCESNSRKRGEVEQAALPRINSSGTRRSQRAPAKYWLGGTPCRRLNMVVKAAGLS